MADEIAYEIVDGSGGRKTRTGWILDRIARVYNIDISVPPSAVILYAVDVLENDGVTIGSAHPSRSTLYLSDFELAGISTEAVKVRLIYKEYPFGDRIIRVGAATSQVVTNRGFLVNEANDQPANTLTDMQVKYTFPADYEGVNAADYASNEFETGAEATRFTPEQTITITRQEVITAQVISDMARDFVGRINASGWLIAPQDPAGVWLCTGIEGISNDNGLSYVVTYSFHHRSDFWEQTVIYIDPNNGRPPPDLAFGTSLGDIGSKNRYAVQNSADFNDLGLE